MSSTPSQGSNFGTSLPVDPLIELERRVNELKAQNEQVKKLVKVAEKVGDLSPQVQLQEQRIDELINRYTRAIQEVRNEDSKVEQQ